MARPTTISTLSFSASGARTIAETVDQALAWVDLAAHDDPDLIILPEAFAAGNDRCQQSPALFAASAEAIDGPTVSRMAQRAARHRCYISAPVVLERAGKLTNSVVMLDRQGQVAGVYDKVYPTIMELEQGRDITPGDDAVVVETDFGRVGHLICFDLNFSDLRRRYAALRPDLVIFSSMFKGGMLARAWALLSASYLVSSYGGEGSVFVNPLGRVLATSSLPHGRILTHRLNLDFQVLHLDYNQRKLDELRRRYGSRIDIELGEAEGTFVLSSNDEALSASAICAEMDLETSDAFFRRSLEARRQAIATGPIPPGPPQW